MRKGLDDMKNAVKVTGLTKRYDDFTLNHVSFDVPQGSIVGLIGENGAGKSTVIKAILGMINRDEGEVSLFEGGDITTQDKEQVGAVFDDKGYPEMLAKADRQGYEGNLFPVGCAVLRKISEGIFIAGG